MSEQDPKEEKISIPYDDFCALRLIATANETSIPHLIRYWMLVFLDARPDLKDEHFPR